MVDLPADANVATVNSITLPENAGDVNWNIPMLDDITLEYFFTYFYFSFSNIMFQALRRRVVHFRSFVRKESRY